MSFFFSIRRSTRGRTIAAVLGLLFLLAPLASCGAPAPLQLKALNLGIPANAMNSPVVGTVPDTTVLHVRITFKLDQNLLNQMQNQKVQPGQSSNLENFASKLGISSSTYQKIKEFFSPAGIALRLSKLRTQLAVDAKAGTLATLLQTKFVIHKYNGRTFYAPTTEPKLPAFLANSIAAITGLDNYSSPPVHDFTMATNTSAVKRKPGQSCYANANTLIPTQVAHAYGYDQLWQHGWQGENMTLNLVEVDGFNSSDIQNYFDCINYKGNFSVVNVDGAPTQALGESTLDVQMAAGLAPDINIMDYQTDGNSNGDVWGQVNDELQQILNDNVNNASSGSVVSISLGAAESEMTSNDINAIDQSIQQLTKAEHMTVFVASGDCAAFTTRVYGQLSVSFPASDPWVTSVGGTILVPNANSARANEIAWSNGSNSSRCQNQWGTGGGNSTLFSRPGWQSASGVNNQYSRNARQVPDVSAVAYALAVYFQGQWSAVGGTSAASPIWATGMALVNEGMIQQQHKFTYSPQVFYLAANKRTGLSPYYDVTRGNNLYYPATPGWDFATGLGTPNLADFYRVVSSTA